MFDSKHYGKTNLQIFCSFFFAHPIGWVECNISSDKNAIFMHGKSSYVHKFIGGLAEC
jgi:hypothetical protein